MENNNSELMVKGKIKVCGIEVPNVYGGFGGDQRVILAKTVAELHNMETRVINQDINRHILKGYFEEEIDFVDLKQVTGGDVFLDELKSQKVFTKAQIGNAKNIYLLSQQGYTLLLKLLGSELAMKQYKEVIRDYFSIKEVIQTQAITPDELKQLVAREIGTIKRNKETEAMSILKSRGELSHFYNPYACITNKIA